ncbi:MAG: hypothetical protein KAV87_41920 [Desulfobacteraceae bacterium]|nr:hypothetical protein [Desulfobacteraceae bacterium]
MKTFSFLLTFMITIGGILCIAQINSTIDNIIPSKAFIIFTQKSWGCLIGQEVKEDVSAKIAKDDYVYANIQEIKNPEDVFNRNELYLIFPAKPVNELDGNFVVKFWCDFDQPQKKAYLSMDYAKIYKKDSGKWILLVKIKGNGFVHVQMLYSRLPVIRQALFSCPQAGVYQPSRRTFFSAYPLEGRFDGVPQQILSDEWKTLKLAFNPIFLEGAVLVDNCQAFFAMLDEEFAIAGQTMVWERKKIQVDTIKMLIDQACKLTKEKTFQVLLKLDDGSTIYVDSDNFVPHLRQKLAIKNPDGKLIGAELWLSFLN